VRTSRPYGISKTLKEFVLGKGKTRAYRSVKLLFLSPLHWGGFYPSPGVADGGFPRAYPFGGGFPWLIGGYPRLISALRVLHS